jgi:ribonuclease HII
MVGFALASVFRGENVTSLIKAEIALLPNIASTTTKEYISNLIERKLASGKIEESQVDAMRLEMEQNRRKRAPMETIDFCLQQINAAYAIAKETRDELLRQFVEQMENDTLQYLHIQPTEV